MIKENQENNIKIIPEQLVKARETLGLKQDEVADKLNINISDLLQWEKGISEPSIEVLWNLAELYQRSTDYFLEHLPSLPQHLNFRLERKKALYDLPQEVRNTIVRFDELCRAETELEEALDRPRKILIKRTIAIRSPDELAVKERQRLDLQIRPIKDLRQLLIKQGGRVFVLPIPDVSANELSGISWWHEKYGPCILINGKNTLGRRNFTLAHEYAHLLKGDPPTVCAYMLEIPEEQFANKFAAAFLMPDADVRSFYKDIMAGYQEEIPTDKELGKIANRYRVSLEAIGIRLESLSLIPKGTTNLRISDLGKNPPHFRGRRGPVWRRQLGEEFVSLALEAHSEGLVSLSKLSEYFGQDIRTVMKVAEESKGQRT